MIPPPRNSHWALAPKNRPPRRHQICDCNILQLLQYMRRIQWITSHPVHHSTLKHESGQSTIIPNPQSWISGDLFREIPENWSTTILGNSLATRRFRSLWFVQGIHPIPSDQSDHPRNPHLWWFQLAKPPADPEKSLEVSGGFFCFSCWDPTHSFWAVFPACPDECHPLLQCYLDFFFIKLKKQVKLSFAKTIPWVGRWSFPFLGASKAGPYLTFVFFWEVFHQCFKNSQLKTSIPHLHWT